MAACGQTSRVNQVYHTKNPEVVLPPRMVASKKTRKRKVRTHVVQSNEESSDNEHDSAGEAFDPSSVVNQTAAEDVAGSSSQARATPFVPPPRRRVKRVKI